MTTSDATPYLPARRSLSALRAAAADCRGCDLHEPATQTVFGEGPCPAQLMLVGEVPGRPIDSDLAKLVTASAHPSAILRGRDDESRAAMREALAADLRVVAEFLRAAAAP